MKGPAHGALVAGVNSAVVTGWVRRKAIERYNPQVEPPSFRDRLDNRTPHILAGIGFTGLSTAVAMGFDAVEMKLLQDYESEIHYRMQGGNHRELHSLPYLGAGIGAAYLLKHSAARFSRWLGERLQIPEAVHELTDALEELADWVIRSVGTGIAGHLIGDIPTKGRGGTALRLLKPITNRNFSLGWVKAASPSGNQYLIYAGSVLTGGAWVFSGTYAASWKPPEQRIRSYVDDFRDCEGYRAALIKVREDIAQTLAKVLNMGSDAIWGLPLFSDTRGLYPQKGVVQKLSFDVDPSVFGVDCLNKETLLETDIFPPDLEEPLSTVSVYDSQHDWPKLDGIPLVEPDHYDQSVSELYTKREKEDRVDIYSDEGDSIKNTTHEPLFTNSKETGTEDI